jgi:hypothetical protein
MREAKWIRDDQGAEGQFPLQDYISEHSKVKVWCRNTNSKEDNLYDIKTVDVMTHVQKIDPRFVPSSMSVLDANNVEPLYFRILRNLFIDKLSLTTIKQQSSHPRNVILCLKDKRIEDPF